jgi:hypothetical protein
MKKSNLKVGDKIVQIVSGAGSGIPLEITDIDRECGIIGMGYYGCSYDGVQVNHKYVRDDGSLEEITNE